MSNNMFHDENDSIYLFCVGILFIIISLCFIFKFKNIGFIFLLILGFGMTWKGIFYNN